MPGPDVDVAVVGDGPAGLALAAACRSVGLAVVVVGPDEPWRNTYGTWLDDVPDLPRTLFAAVAERVVAHGERPHELGRPYAVIDNAALRDHLGTGLDRHVARASSVQQFGWGHRVVSDAGAVDARLVVDATGRAGALAARPSPVAWQTALGVVVDEVPPDAAVERGAATLMDFREPPGGVAGVGAPTFCYVVPLGDRWLVEETVLAARHAVAPDALGARLAARLGSDGAALVADATRAGGDHAAERVRIGMGGPLPRVVPGSPVPFGAAAGYVHPATGYSVAASLRAAPRVAAAIADDRDVWEGVWPRAHRRARVLHDLGLAALLRLDADATRRFFDAFFDLPPGDWRDYLHVDVDAGRVAGVMRELFSAAPWPVRRRLMAMNPLTLARLARP